MFGNTTGWIISAVVGLLMTILLSMVVLPPTPTPPTYAAVFNVVQKPLAIPIDPSTVVPRGTEEGNAGALYRKAIADYELNPTPYDTFQEHIMKIDVKSLTAINYVLKARDCKTGSLFVAKPSDLINYDNAEPGLDAIDTVGKLCCTVGKLYINEKYNPKTRPQEALKLWEAAFVLGQHLYEERLTWDELGRGLGLMQTAAIDLQLYYTDIAKDPSKADGIQSFMNAEADYQGKLIAAVQLIEGVEESKVGQYAGDIFAIAAAKPGAAYGSADPMWRVEAIKHVGKYRFNAQTNGDQLAARKVLSKMVEDPTLSPPVKAAATAAHDLTIEKYHAFG
ncbi:MAG TPA: hypothetical protein VG326_09285 [Tepidisphaeraceae bacterium]|jgi:hypothetical protein|nr:hypothetical protein [Tepidisphaeraceae bacterium]